MSITDELRTGGIYRFPSNRRVFTEEELTAIADRIDDQHEKESEAAWQRGYDRGEDDAEFERLDELRKEVQADWVPLPVDANGKVIHVEDEVELLDGSKRFNAEWLEWDGEDWVVHETIGYGAYHEPSSLRHYHEPTVEDVLRDVVTLCHNTWKEESPFRFCDVDDVMKSGNIADYAAKLRLAKEDA